MINRVITILKWPLALALLVALPGSALALWAVLVDMWSSLESMWPFLGGLVGYGMLWALVLAKPAWGSLFSTLEHEFTHAIFALLTGNRVHGLKATWRSGGQVTYSGGGNWLILVAPYFFPSLSFFVAVGLSLVPGDYPTWASSVLGVTISYHLISTYRETHREQSDLKRAGFLFSLLFLPAANVMSYGVLLAFAMGGLSRVGEYFACFWQHTWRIMEWLLALLRG